MPASVHEVELRKAESGSSDEWEEIIPRGQVSYPSEPQFRFIIEAEINYIPVSELTWESEGELGKFVTIINRFSIPIRLLQSAEATWRRSIFEMWMSMDEPCELEKGWAEKIYESAYEMMGGDDKAPCMKVDAKAMILVDDEDVGDEKLIDVSALSEDVCPICLEGFEGCRGGLELWRLRCSHVYHSACIMKWTRTSTLCPYCRQDGWPDH